MHPSFRTLYTIILSVFILSMSCYGNGKPQFVRKRAYPFHQGEVLHLTVYYNWGPIWLKAGTATLTTSTETYNKTPAYHFVATGKSLKKWDWLFKLRDKYQSYVRSCDLYPLFYEKNTLEGGYMIHNRYFFFPEEKQIRIITEESRKPYHDTTVVADQTIHDVLSAVYLLRTYDVDTLIPNTLIHIPVILDGTIYTQNITYRGKAILSHNGEEIPALLYTALLTESTFFTGDEVLKVYVSDDKNRFPLFIRADIIVGSIKIFLKPFEDITVAKEPE